MAVEHTGFSTVSGQYTMSGITRFLVFILTIAVLFTGSTAVMTIILKPIRSTGIEIGLIFIPEAGVDGHKYIETARTIQESSDLRVWVALTVRYDSDVVNAQEVGTAISLAIGELQQAGMTSAFYVGVGHGIGGTFLYDFASEQNLKALVLMGSTIYRPSQLASPEIPVLTLAAELDGVTRITRVVEQYEKLTVGVPNFFPGIYRTPIIIINGANHAQFASGKASSFFRKSKDLAPEFSEDKAHCVIGKYVHHFLTVTFSPISLDIGESYDQLLNAFLKTVTKLQPFLEIKKLDINGDKSMWTILAQERFAGEYKDKVSISNKIVQNPWFFGARASITYNHDHVILGTTALVDETKSDRESPLEVNMKLVSKNALWKYFDGQNDTALRSEPNTCGSLNRFALYLALAVSTDAARERYYSRGRPIIFEEDAMRGMNILWAPSPLQMWEDEYGLHVRSVAMVTATEHYCKVMSLYRAMEWVNVDSLRVFTYHG